MDVLAQQQEQQQRQQLIQQYQLQQAQLQQAQLQQAQMQQAQMQQAQMQQQFGLQYQGRFMAPPRAKVAGGTPYSHSFFPTARPNTHMYL